jgi:6-phosphogluconolactonase
VSDERCVPLSSDDSNFGHAARGMLDALGVPAARRFPWPVELPPLEAAAAYEAAWAARSPAQAFDLCVLGLGDDSHIASLWPQCPLIGRASGPRFVATEWPGRGWRLTITEAGLAQCASIVVLVGGAAKAPALREIACGEFSPALHPGQTLRAFASRVTWLADREAAAQL